MRHFLDLEATFLGSLPRSRTSHQPQTGTIAFRDWTMGISNSDLLYLLLTSQRELLWAVYAFVQALENTGKPSYAELASQWQKWID